MESEPGAPKAIKKLTNDVINLIAAAEIIHRPANAVKELIENALDAGSTSIKITVKEGGLKLLQITDNGHGINRVDLPLLAERYATSKLVDFSDLQSLSTYGFRGEALASISYCAHLEVITKTRADSCGWKAQYENGELKSEPRPTAANDGTVITAEDLFYNMPLRKRAFRSASDEYMRLLDVITKYAVHNPHVAWTCKKAGSALPDVSTSAESTARANIGLLYSPALANELLEVPETVFSAKLGASIRGWVSNANSNWARKGGWLLFINHRLVDSSKMKKAIDGLYTAFLAKGASPFVYLSLQIDPAKIDVNVHPTKAEVRFLHEDEIVQAVLVAIETTLSSANISRTYSIQTLLPGADGIEKRGESSKQRAAAPNYKVRMDPTNRTLDAMVVITNPSEIEAYDERPPKRRALDENEEVVVVESDEETLDVPLWNATSSEEKRIHDIPESVCEFTSIQDLRRALVKNASQELTDVLARHAFIGVVDRNLCQSLLQHSTKLLLVNHAGLGDEHFYQLGLRQFGALGRLKLQPAPDLADLLRLAAENEQGITDAGLSVDFVVKKTTETLLGKRDMINEYFSLALSEGGAVESIPLLLKGYTPNLDRLPHFLLCLATRVNWDQEKECFETFLRELAFFYSPRPFDSDDMEAEGVDDSEEVAHQLWQLEHILFPSFRRHTLWPRKVAERDINQVANLPDLFRVFERC